MPLESRNLLEDETADEVILMKDASGRVIVFGLLHYRPAHAEAGLAVETVVRTAP